LGEEHLDTAMSYNNLAQLVYENMKIVYFKRKIAEDDTFDNEGLSAKTV